MVGGVELAIIFNSSTLGNIDFFLIVSHNPVFIFFLVPFGHRFIIELLTFVKFLSISISIGSFFSVPFSCLTTNLIFLVNFFGLEIFTVFN